MGFNSVFKGLISVNTVWSRRMVHGKRNWEATPRFVYHYDLLSQIVRL